MPMSRVFTYAFRLFLFLPAVCISYQPWSDKPFSLSEFVRSGEALGLVVGAAAGYFVFYVVPKLTSRNVEHPEDDGA